MKKFDLDIKSSTIDKLIDTISRGIGVIWEPFQMKRMAKAEIQTKSYELEYQKELQQMIEQQTPTPEHAIYKRALLTGLSHSIKSQENIENILKYTYQDIQDKECNQEQVNQTWLNHFFNNAKFISEEDVQILWGKILSNEIQKPNSISIRTIEILKCLSVEEAQLFMKVASVALDSVIPNNEILSELGIKLFDLIKLTEIGLLNTGYTYNLKNNKPVIANYPNYNIIIEPTKDYTVHGIYLLTRSGVELVKVNHIHDHDKCFNIWSRMLGTDARITIREKY
jgi:hypothetical protein